MMTKELHQNLEKYESIFRTAIDSNYYRAMDSRFAAEFIKACKELNVYINTSCPQCVLRALQTVGKLYFDYQEPVKQSNQLKNRLTINHLNPGCLLLFHLKKLLSLIKKLPRMRINYQRKQIRSNYVQY